MVQAGTESYVVRPGETLRAGTAPPLADGYRTWTHWPIYWSAVWVGTLTALCLALIIGLVAVALGAQKVGPSPGIVTWKDIGFGSLFFSIVGAFFSFAAGGWVAGRIAGIRQSEPAMLQAAVVWLLAVPILVVLVALGAGSFFGGWYGGLGGVPVWVTSTGPVADPNAAAAARNAALLTVTALLIGLVGSVIGGWMAAGEPMHPTYYRTRGLAAPVSGTATPH